MSANGACSGVCYGGRGLRCCLETGTRGNEESQWETVLQDGLEASQLFMADFICLPSPSALLLCPLVIVPFLW